jgi:hypothetical protein
VARDQRDAPDQLAVEVAKLKVRVAAEKAEPSRLLKQGIRSAPLASVGGAIGVGALLALLGRRRARAKPFADVSRRFVRRGGGQGAGLGALAVSLALEVARRRYPDLFDGDGKGAPGT